ncbi:MAG: hypothetical protein IID37_08870 [Planctomycetes bacterium]|nr:hypothetical protein [Planctomycetota bacterium]
MAGSQILMTFAREDRFLRRVRFASQFKRGLLHWRHFKDNDPRMSLTYQDLGLQDDTGIDSYQEYFSKFIDGNLPGIFWLSFLGLTQRIDPPLTPRHDPDSSDPEYGDLHCSTESPRYKAQMEMLAKLVHDGQEGGVLRLPQKRSA